MLHSDSPRRFRNLLINPCFQLRFLSYFAGLFLLTSVSLYATLYLFFWRFRDKALKVGIPEGHVFYDFLDYQKQDLDRLFLGLASINFVILLIVGLLLSHRIAGPIEKLKKHLKKETSGKKNFKLRKNDFFQELVPIVQNIKEEQE